MRICSLTGSAFYHFTKQEYSWRFLYSSSCWFATGTTEKSSTQQLIVEHEKETKNKTVGKKPAGRLKW